MPTVQFVQEYSPSSKLGTTQISIHTLVNNQNKGIFKGFPGGSDSKAAAACNTGDPGLIPGLGSSPGEENGNPHQYSCQENSMDKGAWRATAHGFAKSQTGLRS